MSRKDADDATLEAIPIAASLRAKGLSLRNIARELHLRGIPTARGGTWAAPTVRNLLNRKV